MDGDTKPTVLHLDGEGELSLPGGHKIRVRHGRRKGRIYITVPRELAGLIKVADCKGDVPEE